MGKNRKYLFDLDCGHSRKSDNRHAKKLYCLTCDKHSSIVKMYYSLYAVGEEIK